MISILCCYNDEECLSNMLKPSLEKQTAEVEEIFINNKGGKYCSAAEAYNMNVGKANGDILVFSHQDIIIEDDKFFAKIEKIFEENPNIILGLAGIKKDGKVYSNLKYYKNKEAVTRNSVHDEIESVESIDECFFAIKRDKFFSMYFDEKICDYWHLYGVELCYRGKHIKEKIEAYVTNIKAYHKLYPGKWRDGDETFLRSVLMLCKKYRDKEKIIYAPCYVVHTKGIKKYYKIIKTKLKLKLRKVKNKWKDQS